MAAYELVLEKVAVYDEMNLSSVVHEPQNADGAGSYIEIPLHVLGRSEGKAGGADLL